ncbi:multicopper oxidase family protein [Terrihabitans sp. B22-R8]|uniref:multicopper oxidase family protein n=1 Tax=Terrihabitans sp. B22-R8 TaxID=3425128 RepID=UPI00403D363D
MLTRRATLGGLCAVGALALAGRISGARAAPSLPAAPPMPSGRTHDIELVAAETKARFGVLGGPKAPLWLYNEDPFHTIRIRLGDRMRVRLENRLPEHTSIHWHGIRLPNKMDGVQYITQPPVEPGESYDYDFTPPDTGTFFFHSHCDTPKQLGHGLAGLLIVEGDEPAPFDAEHVLAMKDWRLSETGEWLPFFTPEGAGRAGTFGTLRTVNGVEAYAAKVPAGGDIRLRILSVDPTRMIDLGIEGADAFVVATDGNAIAPFPLHLWRMGPAMRIDVHVRVPKAGHSFRMLDYFSAEPWPLAVFTAEGPDRPERPVEARVLYAPHVPSPDMANAERLEFHFTASSGGSAAVVAGLPSDDPLAKALLDNLCAGQQGMWAINKIQWPAGDHRKLPPPLAQLQSGRTYVAELMNATPHPHPIHLHGHMFEVVSASRQNLPRFTADTVLLQPRERIEIAFVAAPGDWMFHCHILEHQENGMMGWFRVA